MNILKRLCSFVLVLSMLLSLAACGDKPDDKKTTSGSQEKTTQADEADPTDAPTQEAKPTDVADREPVELNLYSYGSICAGLEETWEAVNKILKEKLNTTVNFHFYSTTEYDSAVGTMISSGADDMDIIFTSMTRINFDKYVDMNAFLPIEEYREQYLSGTEPLVLEDSWASVTREGHLYAVPTPHDAAVSYNMQVNTTLMDDLGLTFPEDYHTYWDLVDWLYEAKAVRDKKYPEKASQPIIKAFSTRLAGWFNVDPIINDLIYTNIPGVKGFEDMGEGETVYSPYLTKDYRELCKLWAKAVKDGLVAYDSKSYDQDGVLTKTGEYLGQFSLGTIFLNEDSNMPYYKIRLYRAKDAVLTNSGLTSGFAISSKCKYPERALEVIELLNTDEYLATVVRFGPEGVGWTDKDNDGMIEFTEANSDPKNRYNYQWYCWQMGGLTVSKVPPVATLGFAELLDEFNGSGTTSSNLGFILDTEPIINEITACNNVVKEYHTGILTKGQLENVDELCDAFEQKLRDNGIEKILKEVQAQLDAWRKANVK